MRKFFKVTLEEEAILNLNSAYQGLPKTLDYIPGNVFLGIVAKDLTKGPLDNFTLDLLNAKVKFSDAHLIIDNEYSVKVPASFHYDKTADYKDGEYLNYDNINLLHKDLQNLEEQQEQMRDGYICFQTGRYSNLEKNLSLKSARERDKRRSKEKGMFTYEGITPQYVFSMYVDICESVEDSMIIKALKGKKKVGRSKSSQYGQVLIEEDSERFFFKESSFKDIHIYFLSNVALLDPDTKEPTNSIVPSHFGCASSEILWDKSFVRFHSYSSYNRTRDQRDKEKILIQKGSVITLRGGEVEQIKEFCKDGIGVFQNEGLGKVLINPSFLDSSTFKVEKQEKKTLFERYSTVKKSDSLERWFSKKVESSKQTLTTDTSAMDFIKKNRGKGFYKDITNTQWGALRQIGKFSKSDDDLISNVEKFISNGAISEKLWKDCKEDFLGELRKQSSERKVDVKKWLIVVSNKMRREK